MISKLKIAAALAVALLLGGCASIGMSPPPKTDPVEITQAPFYPQTEYHCGPAALATSLNHVGANTTPEQLAPMLYVPGRQGSFQIEMLAATRQMGYLPFPLGGKFNALIEELHAGKPVLVLQNLGLKWWPSWHYAVVVGYDPVDDKVILRSGVHKRVLTKRTTFLRTWARSKYWAIIPSHATQLPATIRPAQVLTTAYAAQETGHGKLAKNAYQTALVKWPNAFDIALVYGNLAYTEGNKDLALHIWKNAITQDNPPAMLFNNLANVYLEVGELEKARKHIDIAISMGGKFLKTFEQTAREIEAAR